VENRTINFKSKKGKNIDITISRFFHIPSCKQYAFSDGIFRILFNTRWRNPLEKQKVEFHEKHSFSFPEHPENFEETPSILGVDIEQEI